MGRPIEGRKRGVRRVARRGLSYGSVAAMGGSGGRTQVCGGPPEGAAGRGAGTIVFLKPAAKAAGS